MSKIAGEVSDEEPEEFLSSGEDWTPKQAEKKRSTRRTSRRIRKKPKVTVDEDSSSDSNDERIDNNKKQKNGSAKRHKTPKRVPHVGMKIVAKDFITGGFLVLKKDIPTGDANNQPCLWRIDGKALLQKYEPFTDQGNSLHRSTSIYTGWSPLEKDLYVPVSVEVQLHSGQQMVVELNWQTVKDSAMDSD